jgi:hypothetical protein
MYILNVSFYTFEKKLEMKKLACIALAGIFLFSACGGGEKEIIAEKIQYDVNIKSPDPEYDWWIQNLVGPQREKLVDYLIDGAVSGKFQAFDYYNNPLKKNEIQSLLSDTMVMSIMENQPPYDYHDTIVIHTIEKTDILKIRFLEEWKIDPENLQFEKKVIGIGPVARRFDANGTERWQPLFWIYIDPIFLKEINSKK